MQGVVVVDYDPGWPRLFQDLRTALWPAVRDIATAVEHVGSTSVPGLAAKPIIDLDIVVEEADVPTGILRLTRVGYRHQGDLGIPGRESFVRPPGTHPHHLYLCPVGSPALANHLAVRDHLRRHPAAARAYGALKRRLAREFSDDIDGYVEGKTAFLVGLLRTAGFSESSLADIVEMNRRPVDGGERTAPHLRPPPAGGHGGPA